MEKTKHKVITALFVCFLSIGELRAQPLSDPMQPPAAVTAAPGAKPSAPPPGGLQGVLTSPSRKFALIDGSVVPLGAPVREGSLAGVSDSVAVLKKQDGRPDVLLMHPNIDKRPARRSEGQ